MPLLQLTPVEQLVAAVLRGDAATARQLLEGAQYDQAFLDTFVKLSNTEGLSNLIFEQVVEINLVPEFSRSHCEQVEPIFTRMNRTARTAAATHYALEGQFGKLLGLLSDITDQMLWVKGIHLCRTIYQRPTSRHFGDIDVILHPSGIDRFVELVKAHNLLAFRQPGDCNQLGVGPTMNLADLFIAPLEGWTPTSVLSLHTRELPMIDIKIAPLDRGLQAIEAERMFAEAEQSSCLGHRYIGPNPSDHLMIILQNLAKDKFSRWQTFYDIDLLSRKMNQSPLLWDKFVKSCQIEAIAENAWMGLTMTVDRLHSPIPEAVLAALSPGNFFILQYMSFTVSPSYVWNTTSLPMLLLNAAASRDWQRKLSMLAKSVFPSRQFLDRYYGSKMLTTSNAYALLLFLHFLLLLLPGGAVRRLFGSSYWRER